ncbi:MAG: EamA family transporter [Candidatus Kaiserbacteria bacterium]|nr:EamA family transporter [Candidatus Kaiserbacteria bacterium]
MTWLGYAFAGITIWSVTATADRFFLIRHVTSKRFYVVVPALLQFSVVLIFAIFFSIPHATPLAALAAIASGATEVILLYYLYTAVSSDEVSRVFPLATAGPIFTLVLGWLFLKETPTPHQLVAFVLFLIGGFLLAAKFNESGASISRAIKPLFIGALFTSVFTLLLRFAFVASNFWSGFFYSRLGFFIGGLIVLYMYRKEITHQWRELELGTRAALIGNQLAAFSGHAFYFLAISLASAALVQSVLGAQSAIILFFAVLVSLWNRDIVKESAAPRDILQKSIGVAFIVAASYLLAV